MENILKQENHVSNCCAVTTSFILDNIPSNTESLSTRGIAAVCVEISNISWYSVTEKLECTLYYVATRRKLPTAREIISGRRQ
jgi:hypothetical protein